jgi:hypothetical protein
MWITDDLQASLPPAAVWKSFEHELFSYLVRAANAYIQGYEDCSAGSEPDTDAVSDQDAYTQGFRDCMDSRINGDHGSQ